jgi:hypothetical protein
MSVARGVVVILLMLGLASDASAALGGDAARGDNCTPFNSYKIGYGVPGGTIVSQSVVLANGWLVAGWILSTSSGRNYFLPNPSFFDRSVNDGNHSTGPSALERLTSGDSAALNAAYRTSRARFKEESRHVDRDSPVRLPAATLVAPCFAHTLTTGR